MKPKIGIIGGGAIGLYFAAQLSVYADVTIFVRRAEQQVKLNTEGIKFGTKIFSVKSALIQEQDLREQDLLLVTVKSYQLAELTSQLETFPKETPLAFLTNGIGHLKWLEELSAKTILLGITSHGVVRTGDREIESSGKGETKLGIWRGKLDEQLKNQFTQFRDFSIQFSEDIFKAIYRKLLINTAVNPLTALLNVPNGSLLTNKEFNNFLREVVQEANQVLHVEDGLDIVEEICRNTASNWSSMAMDVLHKRQTEIDAIVLPVLEMLAREGLSAEKLATLYQLIKGKERENAKLDD
ncbi:2-dehydropantoate 2-reductase [Listeria valentina]|uniref:2-dehydropantoate 2-reductase n=1 Tax=Listeria valentina TaxID=2705293 RepID=UPI00142FC2C6|nr:2-dehydropantoate 2-reductase [Listeria valentina]